MNPLVDQFGKLAPVLDEWWATVLGRSAEQLRDGGQHVVPVPQRTGGLKRPYPLKPDSIAMLARGEGWVLSVPSRLVERAKSLCLGRSFSSFAGEGDRSAERWYARGAKDEEKATMRGAGAYPTLARVAEGLNVRCWSHYFHWYCDGSSWDPGPADGHVREITQDDSSLWEQWVAWSGPFCRLGFSDHFEVSDAFGYILDGRLVSVAQVQADSEDFAWEFGVDTLPPFRRRGFATAVAKAATRRILKHGRIPWYYYDHYNHPSARIPAKAAYFLYAEGLFSHMG